MKTLKVKTKNYVYPVYIGNNYLQRLPNFIIKNNLLNRILFVIDKNVYSIYKNDIEKLIISFKESEFFIFDSNEKNKSTKSVEKIHNILLKNRFGRDTTVIAIGGGILGDTVGFAASTYMRGVKLVHVPTTLLAAVDSSIGGKTGINFQNKKNLIGTFYQPSFIFIDTKFFTTLSEREIVCGIGEIIKYSFISDKSYFNFINQYFNKVLALSKTELEKVIIKSIAIKSQVVEQDETEKSLRKILNLGHTFAHAFESYFDYNIKHGEAVIAGLISASILSNKLSFIDDNTLRKFLSLLLKIKLPVSIKNFNNKKIYDLMLTDKKNRNGSINFVLIGGIGKIYINVQTNKKDIFYSLNKMKEIL